MDGENLNYLVAGLGNPGSAYNETRHNVGFKVVRMLSEKLGFAFHQGSYFNGEIAQGRIEGKKVVLLLPMTYMNSSGQSVKMCADYFKIAPEQSLIVCDDIALPFGTLRLRAEGSAGGHNGLKSVEEHLGTKNYPRLRIGIGDRKQGDLADYVLGRFSADESSALPEIIVKAALSLERWIIEGRDGAIRFLSTKEKKKEEKKE